MRYSQVVCTPLEQASSGRGGVGNIRPESREPIARGRGQGPDDFSPSRGRELRTSVDETVRILSFLFSLSPLLPPFLLSSFTPSLPPLCLAI